MIFRRKKKKLNSKVRFQHKQFTGQLKSARRYKRKPAVKKPQTALAKFLERIGLGTRLRQSLVLLALLAVVYVVYIPNYLTVQTISIVGLSDEDRRQAVTVVEDLIKQSAPLNPQHNIMFTSVGSIEDALLYLGTINTVASIRKDVLNRAIIIDAESKYTRFLLADDERVFDVYNDGTFRSVAGVSRDGWDAVVRDSLVKILVAGSLPLYGTESTVVIEPSTRDIIDSLQMQLSTVDGYQVSFFDFRPLERERIKLQTVEGQEVVVSPDDSQTLSDDETREIIQTDQKEEELPEDPTPDLPLSVVEITVVLAKSDNSIEPFAVLFDTQTVPDQSVKQLDLLLSQTSPERLQNLEYVDMRIEGKAYLCLRNTPCAE